MPDMTVGRLIEILLKMPLTHTIKISDGDNGLKSLEEREIINMDVFGSGHTQVVIG